MLALRLSQSAVYLKCSGFPNKMWYRWPEQENYEEDFCYDVTTYENSFLRAFKPGMEVETNLILNRVADNFSVKAQHDKLVDCLKIFKDVHTNSTFSFQLFMSRNASDFFQSTSGRKIR